MMGRDDGSPRAGEAGAPMPDALQDEDTQRLVRAAQAGDADALDELLVRLQPLVLHRCARFLPYRADAEEAAQDALLAVSRKLGSYSGTGSFRGWVTVVASNSARATYRSLKRRTEVPLATRAERPDPRTTSVIAGTRLDLLDAMETIERDHPQYVEPLILRDVYGMSYDEIAQQMGAPIGTVKAQIHHGRKLARPLLRGQD
jgi:RNA polymerase sigma-70 factor (ECF subfamily)